MWEFNMEPTQQLHVTIIQQGAAIKAGKGKVVALLN
jgi:hypothetical protein